MILTQKQRETLEMAKRLEETGDTAGMFLYGGPYGPEVLKHLIIKGLFEQAKEGPVAKTGE